jgi:hypothetical protein
MAETLIIYQLGVPAVAEEEVTFLGIGSAGDPDACRLMTHPNNFVAAALAPITYTVGPYCFNPTRVLNLDNAVLNHPITSAPLTIGGRKVVRFETSQSDVIITEIWEGSNEKASMPTALFRQFKEYLDNPPPLDVSAPEFIIWEPRDRNQLSYEIELLDLSVGGGAAGGNDTRFDVVDLRGPGGIFRGGTIENATDGLNTIATGLIDRTVTLRFRIVGIVP